MFQIALIHFQWFNDDAGGLAVYQDVITRFPGSRFEVRARRYTLDHTIGWRRQPELWLQGQSEIVRSYGAPTITEITGSGNHDSLTERVHALPLEIQVGVMSIYTHCEVLFAFETGRYDEAIALGSFNRQTFMADAFSEYSPLASQFLQYALVAKHLGSGEWKSAPVLDPVIERRGPKTGHKTGNRRPKISVEITAGDYLQPQVDFSKLEFSVSGLDLKPYARVDSHIDRKPGKGKVYERLRLTARPPQPLADGTYEVRVVAPVHGYRGDGPGRAATTWHFTVAHGGPHHDDEGEDCR